VFQDKERHGTLRKFAWTTIIRHRLVPPRIPPMTDPPGLLEPTRQRTHVTPGRSEQLAGGNTGAVRSATRLWTMGKRSTSTT